MKKYYARAFAVALALLSFVACLTACNRVPEPTPEPTIDPYEGLIQVSDGMGGLMWVPDYEEVPIFQLDHSNFYRDGEFIRYSGDNQSVRLGIDVSFYQKTIDWQKVKDAGIEFAIIRAGYRGFSEGTIYADSEFVNNIEGALAVGIEVGIYFFSQAITPEEAAEEADFVISLIDGYNVTLPVAFDWENIGADSAARTDNVSGSVLTDCALTFAEKIAGAGYQPAVYFYRRLGYYQYELDRIAHIPFWVGAPGDVPDFHYDHFMWQFSFTGKVDGIDADVDLNLMFG